MRKVTVLITGVGGPVGVSVLKALRLSDIPCEIIGTDTDELSVGFFLADKFSVLPNACQEPELYMEKLTDLCRKYNVEIIFTGSDAELRLLASCKEAIEEATRAVILVNNSKIIETASDKWKTVEFLRSHNIPVPYSALPGDSNKINDLIKEKGFPLLVKPRFSSGSKGVFIVKNQKQLAAVLELVENAVVQEYLNPPDQEYTVGVFTDKCGLFIGSIIFQRWLGGGLTYKALVSTNQEIENIAKNASTALGAVGPVNVQLRLTKDGPVIFEINPRISSSAVMRANFGFNEPALAIKHFLFNEPIKRPIVKNGIALRYWEEFYL